MRFILSVPLIAVVMVLYAAFAIDPEQFSAGSAFMDWVLPSGAEFFLTFGDLFVIPRDARAFAAGLELRLWVNDRLRQSAPLDSITWKLDDLVARERDKLIAPRRRVPSRVRDRVPMQIPPPDGCVQRLAHREREAVARRVG